MARILVTGSSGGLGMNAATELASRGHEVVVHARRSPGRPAQGAASWLGVVFGDLADLDQTRGVADQAAAFGRFDAVIHNAGALRPPEAVPVNIVAPYALTALIEKPGRLIYLSSSMHRGGSTDLRGLGSGRGPTPTASSG